MDLYREYKKLQLRSMFPKNPADEKQAIEERRKFERKHPHIADEVFFKSKTDY